MKRFIVVLILFLLLPITAKGEEINTEGYNESLASYDLSFFDETLDGETNEILSELGVDKFSFENIYNLSISDVKKVFTSIIRDKLKSPLEGVSAVALFILLSSFFQSFKSDSEDMQELYSTVSALVISVILIAKISPAITLARASISISSNFVYAFIPVFCAIVAASGGITVGFSTNTLLLLLSQGLSMLSSNFFMPLINCFLATGICSSLRPQLGLGKLTDAARRIITSIMSFFAGAYVSVLSIKTAASARVDVLGLRSMRFVISTVVPVVGGALSEGLVSIQTYSSLIKSSVGIVGIIALAFVFLPSIIEVVIWRVLLSLGAVISDIFEDAAVSAVLKAFSSAMLIMNVLLIISLLTTVVSIGILVAAGN